MDRLLLGLKRWEQPSAKAAEIRAETEIVNAGADAEAMTATTEAMQH
jgi:hypothetical protein